MLVQRSHAYRRPPWCGAGRVARSLLHDDRLVFALVLAHIFARGSPDELDQGELDHFLSAPAVYSARYLRSPTVLAVMNSAARRLLDIDSMGAAQHFPIPFLSLQRQRDFGQCAGGFGKPGQHRAGIQVRFYFGRMKLP